MDGHAGAGTVVGVAGAIACYIELTRPRLSAAQTYSFLKFMSQMLKVRWLHRFNRAICLMTTYRRKNSYRAFARVSMPPR